jgi:pilus assembly protein CpaC
MLNLRYRFLPAAALAAFLLAALAAPVPSAFAEGSKSIRVFANQSLVLTTEKEVRRISVARPETADVMAITPTEVLVIGKAPGKTTLVYWTEPEGSAPRVFDVTVDVDLDAAREELRKIAPGETFDVSAAGETLVLRGTVTDNTVIARIAEGAKSFSKSVTNLLTARRSPQVLLQVRVSEVDRTKARELGFGALFEGKDLRGSVSVPGSFNPFFGNLRDQQVGNVGPNFTFSDAMNLFVAKPGSFPGFAGLIRVLDEKGGIKTLAEPNLVVENGGEGKFLVGGEFPIVYQSGGAANGVSVVYKEFGIRLHFQPRVADNGEVNLKVSQEVSELDFANGVILSGFQIPALKSRKTESSLQLGDGQTFVMAGLLDRRVTKHVARFPVLGDLPILGALFRSTRYSNDETELMVMVTPKVVRPLEKGELPKLPTETTKEDFSSRMIP